MNDLYQPPEAEIIDRGKRFRWSHAMVAGFCSLLVYAVIATILALYFYSHNPLTINHVDYSRVFILASLFFITAFIAVLPFQRWSKLRAGIVGPLASIALLLLWTTTEYIWS